MRLPEWIKAKQNPSALHAMKSILRGYGITTVCEEARCPNRWECFSKPTATFMILGDRCTRGCGFCSVTKKTPLPPEPDEPRRVASAAKELALRYVVITSVTRDDLEDGGAGHFSETVKEIKKTLSDVRVEVLTPDFKGDINALKTVLLSGPDVFNHNLETVPALYPVVRPEADYRRSLKVLENAKALCPEINTKSGLMLGLGENPDEVVEAMRDLRAVGCDSITIGQYLRPSRKNLPVREYVAPEVFENLRGIALSMGFKYAASAPMVRSSMNAEEIFNSQYTAPIC